MQIGYYLLTYLITLNLHNSLVGIAPCKYIVIIIIIIIIIITIYIAHMPESKINRQIESEAHKKVDITNV